MRLVLTNNQIPKYLKVDETLISRMQHQEDEAFQAFFEQYYDWIFNFVRSHIREYEDIKEITSQILFTAMERIKTLKDPAKFHKWLFGIARHKIIDFYREKHYESESEKVMIDLITEETTNPITEKVQAVLKKLTPEEAQVLKLYYLSGLTVQDLMKITNKSEWAIRKFIERTISKFKKLYER